MKLTEKNSRIVDDFLKELIRHFDAGNGESLTIDEYQQVGNNSLISFHAIFHALIIADYTQKKFVFKAFQLNIIDKKPHVDLQHGFTEAFLSVGGFSAIWQDEENDRIERLATNRSVRTTNTTVMITSSVSVLAAIVSVIIALYTYKKPIEDLKEVNKIPTQLELLRGSIEKTNSLHILNHIQIQDSSKKK